MLHNYDAFLSFLDLYEMKSVNIAFGVAKCLNKFQAPSGRLNLMIMAMDRKKGSRTMENSA